MALTRKMLQAMDISDDKIDQIIDAHKSTISGLTDERDKLIEERDKLKTENTRLANVEKDLVKAQAKLDDAADSAQKLTDLQKQFDEYKADVDAKAKAASKTAAYKALLREAGISEKRIEAVLKVSDISKIELDADGKIKDSKTVIDGIKSEWADFIVTEGKKGADTATPPANDGGVDYDKMSDSDYYKATYEAKKGK